MKTMKAIWFEDHKISLNTKYPIPTCESGYAKIKVLRTGICSTDMELLNGYASFKGIPGHEFVGVVCEMNGQHSTIRLGMRVVGEINIRCHDCDTCKGNNFIQSRNHCPNRKCLGIRFHDGAFAEYLTLPLENLFPVPENISDEIAVFTEPVAAACRIVEQFKTKLQSSSRIAVVGDGKLGLMIAGVLLSALEDADTPNISIIGKHQTKLAKLAYDVVGKPITCILLDQNTTNTYRDQFDLTIEATASHSGLHLCSMITKPQGLIILKSTCSTSEDTTRPQPSSELVAEAQNNIVVKELCVQGSRCGPFEMALQLLCNPNAPITKLLPSLVEIVLSVDEYKRGFERAHQPGVLKIQMTYNS